MKNNNISEIIPNAKELVMNSRNVPKLRFGGFEGEWEMKKLVDFAPLQRGFDLPVVDIQNGKYPVVFSNGILKTHNEFKAKAPGVVTGRSGTIGKITFVQEDYWPHNTTLWVTDFKNNDPKFVYYFYSNFELEKLGTGSGVPTLNRNDVHAKTAFFPTLPEQQKIATFLTAVDEKIQQLSRKKELLEQYKKGVMQQLFSGKLRFKDEHGTDFADWEEKTLGEVAKFRRGSFPQPYGLPKWYDDENGLPFIQVYDVDNNMLLKKTTKNKISKLGAEQSVFVKKGTLVITIQGSIGRIAKTQYDAYVDRTLLIFQSYKLPTDVDYFKYVVFLLFEIEKTKAPGGTIKTITKEVLTDFIVPIPCLKEQQKIADFLSNIDTKIQNTNEQITHMQNFKKGLLQQLFV